MADDQVRVVDVLELASGSRIERPLDRLKRFCEGEYAYYDAILSANPNRIDPLDVLVTVAMNSFVNSAVKAHRVHQGMAANCEPSWRQSPKTRTWLTSTAGAHRCANSYMRQSRHPRC